MDAPPTSRRLPRGRPPARAGKKFRIARPGPRLLAGVAALAACACGGGAEEATGASWPDRPNLVLISLDTLRRDRVSAYVEAESGEAPEPPTTPELDRFAGRALRFDRAYTHQPWTLTAHMTMLTSLYPSVHGLAAERELSPAATTLAEAVGAAGYDTFAVVDSCPWVAPEFGFERGFREYEVVAAGPGTKVKRFLAAVDAAGRPFLGFAHFFAAHSAWGDGLPYRSAPLDREAFTAWYEGDFDGEDPELDLGASELLLHWNQEGFVPARAEREFVADLYDAGVHTLDRHLGRLFAGLEERGLFADTVLLVTSDHGEEFWEHGQALHGQYYDECLRIPFLLRTPDSRSGSSDRLVGLVDVMPTLLDFAGVPSPQAQGHSLAPLARGEDPGWERDWLPVDPSFLLGLHDSERALIWTEEGVAYFDLERDPEQLENLLRDVGERERVQETVETVRRAWERMGPLRERFAPLEREPLTDDELEQLQGLGYVGYEGEEPEGEPGRE